MKVLFLTKYPIQGASSRYRVYQYLPHLDAAGIGYAVEPFMSLAMYKLSQQSGHTIAKVGGLVAAMMRRLGTLWRCGDYDVVFMQRECLPFGPLLLERWFSWRGKVTIFDYDDALFLYKPNKLNPLVNVFKKPHRIPAIMQQVDCVLAGNDWLRDSAAQYCIDSRTFYVAEDLSRYTQRPEMTDESTVTIGWLGSATTEKYLELIKPVLLELSLRYPGLRVKVVGGGGFFDPRIQIEHVPWTLEGEVAQLHSFDIGIMPLPLEEWSLGKSGGKARTYMAVGLPVVCTAIGFNTELVSHGETGFLATDLGDWSESLSRLIESVELRSQLGRAARKEVEKRFALERLGPQFAHILKDIAATAAAPIG